MKKLLLSSIVLFLFSASIVMFQMSCKKEAKADEPTRTQSDEIKQLGKVLYISWGNNVTSTPTKVYLCNYDGSSSQEINLTFPTDSKWVEPNEFRLSPDGKKIFYSVELGSTLKTYIYSWDINGKNRELVAEGTLQGVY